MALDRTFTRRNILVTAAAGSTIVIAGCGSTNDETDDDGELIVAGENDGKSVAREPEEILYISREEERTLKSNGQYDAVELEPTGAILFESNSNLRFHDLVNE